MSKALETKFRKKKNVKASHGTGVSGRAVELVVEDDPADGVVVLEELKPPVGSGSGSGSGLPGPRPPPR
jgi:hypothetical protein